MIKDIWIDLPALNGKHAVYPALFTSNNVLFCIGGSHHRYIRDMGWIEMYDPRDISQKWIAIDSVQNHFNIPHDTGAGFNCCIPF